MRYVEDLASRRLPVCSVRVWPFQMNEASEIFARHGYRLRHIESDRDGDKGNDLIYETVWQLAAEPK